MKYIIRYTMASILAAGLLACSQEQTEPKESLSGAEKTGGSLSFFSVNSKEGSSAVSATVASAKEQVSEEPAAESQESLLLSTVAANSDVEKPATRADKEQKKAEKQLERDLRAAEKEKKRLAKRGPALPPSALSDAEKRRLEQRHMDALMAASQESSKNLTSADDSLRKEALMDLDPDNSGDLKVLMKALLSDPDPAIREEIAGMLSFGDYQAALPSLLKALSDPEPQVVISTMSSLGWYDNQQVADAIHEIQLNTQNKLVQNAAKETLELMNTAPTKDLNMAVVQ